MMDMPGTALSLSAAIFGALQGQLGSLCSKWLDYKYKTKHLKAETYLKDLDSARNAKGKPFLITRRILALLTGCYIFLGPIFAAWWGIPIFSAYTESNGWIASLFYGMTTVHWESVRGYVMSPEQTYLASLTWTLYFGGKNVWG